MNNKVEVKAKEEISLDIIQKENRRLKEIIGNNYDKYIEIQEEINTIFKEYTSLLDINKKLEEDNVEQKKIINKLQIEINDNNNLIKSMQIEKKNIEQRLYALKNSKLGKINTAYWSFKNKRKEKLK